MHLEREREREKEKVIIYRRDIGGGFAQTKFHIL